MYLVFVFLCFTALQAQVCLPGQFKCGQTCCNQSFTCCQGSATKGCAPPGQSCCASSPSGFCKIGESCCQNGCAPIGGSCCGKFACGSDEACCIGFGCYKRNGTQACCNSVGLYTPSTQRCCNQVPNSNSWPQVCTMDETCCYARYAYPCMNPTTTTCCPSIYYKPLSFTVPGVNATCCGDLSSDYGCRPPKVCCPSLNPPPSRHAEPRPRIHAGSVHHDSQSVKKKPAKRDDLETAQKRDPCADPASDFCCPHIDFYSHGGDGGFYTTSSGCPLGTLCCPGGYDNNGNQQIGGCCLGFNASSYNCGVNGAPVCPWKS